MYSAKYGIDDYLKEINRLIPETGENKMFDIPQTSQVSPFSNSTVRSSSSTDSISPESLYDVHHRGAVSLLMNQINSPTHEPDSPYQVRKQRPIVGRRLMSQNTTLMFSENRNYAHTDSSHSLNDTYNLNPLSIANFNDHQSNTSFYELFPSNDKHPNKATTKGNVSNMSVYTPKSSPSLPDYSNMPHNILEPFIPLSTMPMRPSSAFFRQGSSKIPETGKICSFCRKNGETPIVYMTHMVKEKVGSKHIVTCPILRSHVCSTCGAFGDDAHTKTYCPVLRSSNNGQPLLSTTITLKNTRIKSNGRRRY